MVINDNIVDLVITPAAQTGKPASVRLHPQTNMVQMDAWVDTVADGDKAKAGRAKAAKPNDVKEPKPGNKPEAGTVEPILPS